MKTRRIRRCSEVVYRWSLGGLKLLPKSLQESGENPLKKRQSGRAEQTGTLLRVKGAYFLPPKQAFKNG